MVGGILQLVTKGSDDVFLIQDPKITLFKTVYRRHGNFCSTEQTLNFPNKIMPGKQGICHVKRLADLLHRMYLIIDLPDAVAEYQILTFDKLNSILSSVGLNNMVLQLGYAPEERVSRDFYENAIIPLIENEILRMTNAHDLANEELNTMERYLTSYDPKAYNISK